MLFRKFLLPMFVKEVVREITKSDPDDTVFDKVEQAVDNRRARKAIKRSRKDGRR